MKHTLTLITVTVMLALAQRAMADGFQGTTTEFSKVNVALIVETNKAAVERGNAVIDSTAKAKIDNKTILNLFAVASGANTNEWRTNGAQLIFDWSTTPPQMAIADKTGTNILLYLGSANPVNNGTVQAYFDVDWFYDAADNPGTWQYNALKDKYSGTNPGTDNISSTTQGYFELSYTDSSNPASNLTLYGYGPNMEHYVQHWNQSHTMTMWTDMENFKPFGAGQKVNINGQSKATVNGTIKANGKGSGNNTFIYPLS